MYKYNERIYILLPTSVRNYFNNNLTILGSDDLDLYCKLFTRAHETVYLKN